MKLQSGSSLVLVGSSSLCLYVMLTANIIGRLVYSILFTIEFVHIVRKEDDKI